VRIDVLSPDRQPLNAADVNDQSVVLRLQYGATCFLFMGDAGIAVESRLEAQSPESLRCGAVKVAHHGSETASSASFINAVRAGATSRTQAIVSVARNNLFGLPDSTILARWRSNDATVRITMNAGAILMRSDGKRIYPVNWK